MIKRLLHKSEFPSLFPFLFVQPQPLPTLLLQPAIGPRQPANQPTAANFPRHLLKFSQCGVCGVWVQGWSNCTVIV
ncbi:hypothetical protein HYPBUDRAFT_151114 [Hyphopichia burtonii NRRL Y-1933]|uniref:Uncharacterized protein n=1 Tax=Hyphopichia burtonii NRRL Y-1933 TaxID=984485 RepID=A0A1E4RPT3_9ASCO|nr:hypothetical protein HYPBUDRAFT_151114 [Hyphopichia burtonii NRRL Y-1933]ODV69277.1 hypothetical protein HYPBUDRAFT_151114 [Hyphopichia burtonii NRRL Y-1933]